MEKRLEKSLDKWVAKSSLESKRDLKMSDSLESLSMYVLARKVSLIFIIFVVYGVRFIDLVTLIPMSNAIL